MSVIPYGNYMNRIWLSNINHNHHDSDKCIKWRKRVPCTQSPLSRYIELMSNERGSMSSMKGILIDKDDTIVPSAQLLSGCPRKFLCNSISLYLISIAHLFWLGTWISNIWLIKYIYLLCDIGNFDRYKAKSLWAGNLNLNDHMWIPLSS